MKKSNNEKGSILVFTLMTILVLSILGLAMLPLTVMEFKSSKHFANYEKAYFLAEAGLEEAVANLDFDWISYTGNPGTELNDGEYQIEVDGTGDSRIVTATGKINNIQRTLKANMERPSTQINLAELKEYAIFTQGDLEVEELGNINSLGAEKGIIGVKGDFNFKQAQTAGTAYLEVEGNIEVPESNKITGTYYPDHFPSSPKELVDLSGFNIEYYIEWLKVNHGENVTSYEATEGEDKYSYTGSGGLENEIIIFEDYGTEISLGGTINGLIIIKNTQTLKVKNNTTINGMIMFDGSDLEITEFQISGSKIEVNGSLICTNNATQKGNWKLELNHAPSILANLDAYLPEDFEGGTSDSESTIKVLNWKEVN